MFRSARFAGQILKTNCPYCDPLYLVILFSLLPSCHDADTCCETVAAPDLRIFIHFHCFHFRDISCLFMTGWSSTAKCLTCQHTPFLDEDTASMF